VVTRVSKLAPAPPPMPYALPCVQLVKT
jgi:hypothetical protein